jgi:hypothetical protein
MQRELDEQAAAHLASAQQLCVLLAEGRLAQADRTVQVLTESLRLVGDRLREALAAEAVPEPEAEAEVEHAADGQPGDAVADAEAGDASDQSTNVVGARQLEIEALLEQPELGNLQRQALVAERIKLAAEAEARRRGERLAELMEGDLIPDFLGCLRAAEGGVGDCEAKAFRAAEVRADLELVFSATQGRERLAQELVGCAENGRETFPPQGFSLLCGAVNHMLSHMAEAAAPLFEHFLVCRAPAADGSRGVASFTHHTGYPNPVEAPKGVENFCFPCDPGVAPPPRRYSIVRTLDDGTRQYGFCAAVGREFISVSLADEGQPGPWQVVCLLTRYPWFSMFEALLTTLVERFERYERYKSRGVTSQGGVEACT